MIIGMHFHNACEPQSDACCIKLRGTNQTSGNPLLISLHTIACDDSGSGEDEVRAERLNDCGWKHSWPIGLLRRHCC